MSSVSLALSRCSLQSHSPPLQYQSSDQDSNLIKEHHFLSTFLIWTRPGKKVLLKVRPLDVRQNLYMFFISKLNFYVACARVLHLYELPMILTPARWASFTILIMSPGSTPFNTGCFICAEI